MHQIVADGRPPSTVHRPPSTVHRDAEGSRTPDWPGCSRSPLPLGYGITSLLVDPERLELSLSSLQARRFPSKLQAQAWFGKGELGTPKAPAWGPCTPSIGFAERDRTAGLLGHSQVLCRSATANIQDMVPCQGFEPQLAGSEPAVLPLDEHGIEDRG